MLSLRRQRGRRHRLRLHEDLFVTFEKLQPPRLPSGRPMWSAASTGPKIDCRVEMLGRTPLTSSVTPAFEPLVAGLPKPVVTVASAASAVSSPRRSPCERTERISPGKLSSLRAPGALSPGTPFSCRMPSASIPVPVVGAPSALGSNPWSRRPRVEGLARPFLGSLSSLRDPFRPFTQRAAVRHPQQRNPAARPGHRRPKVKGWPGPQLISALGVPVLQPLVSLDGLVCHLLKLPTSTDAITKGPKNADRPSHQFIRKDNAQTVQLTRIW
jgi:hypothetical protein